jgi:hypothetical protein
MLNFRLHCSHKPYYVTTQTVIILPYLQYNLVLLAAGVVHFSGFPFPGIPGVSLSVAIPWFLLMPVNISKCRRILLQLPVKIDIPDITLTANSLGTRQSLRGLKPGPGCGMSRHTQCPDRGSDGRSRGCHSVVMGFPSQMASLIKKTV